MLREELLLEELVLLWRQEIQVLHVLTIYWCTGNLLRLLDHGSTLLRTLPVVLNSLILFYILSVTVLDNIAEFLLRLSDRGLHLLKSLNIRKLGSFSGTGTQCLQTLQGVAPMHHSCPLLGGHLGLVRSRRVALRLDKLGYRLGDLYGFQLAGSAFHTLICLVWLTSGVRVTHYCALLSLTRIRAHLVNFLDRYFGAG